MLLLLVLYMGSRFSSMDCRKIAGLMLLLVLYTLRHFFCLDCLHIAFICLDWHHIAGLMLLLVLYTGSRFSSVDCRQIAGCGRCEWMGKFITDSTWSGVAGGYVLVVEVAMIWD